MTLNLVTKTENIELNPRRHAEAFKNMTGLTVNVHAVDYSNLYDEMISDFKQGSPFYDLFIFGPPWISDFVDCSSKGCTKPYLEDLTDRVRSDSVIDWPDVNTFFRTFSSLYDDKVYTVPFDGDVVFTYVRLDLLNKYNLSIPTTWDQAMSIAARFHGTDINGDGQPDSGFCVHRKPKEQAVNLFFSIATPFLQLGGTKTGAFFDPNTMDPLINNDGMAEALKIYKDIRKYSSDQEMTIGLGTTREWFTQGRCVFTIDWGDIPVIANKTKFRDAIMPLLSIGTKQVWDRNAKKLATCNPQLCPFMSAEGVNQAPYAAFGGWSGGVASQIPAMRKQAAYDFLAFLSSPAISSVDVVMGNGFEMYRKSQMNSAFLLANGFAPLVATEMPKQVFAALNNPNVVMDIRLPQGDTYFSAVDDALAKYNLEQADIPTTMKTMETAWRQLVAKSDLKTILNIYRKSIGLPALDFKTEVTISSGAQIAIIVLSGISIFIALVILVLLFINREKPSVKAAAPFFCYLVVIGGLLMFISMILYSLPVTDNLCMAIPWVLNTGFVMLFGNLVTKNYRIARIFAQSRKLQTVNLSNRALIPGVLALLSLNFIILICWTAIDRMKVEQSGDGVGTLEYILVCRSDKWSIWIGALVILDFAILLLGCFLSFQTRNIAVKAFNESKYIAASTYNFSVTAIIVVPVAILIKEPLAKFIIVGIGIIFAALFSLCTIFIPKFFESELSGSSGGSTTITGKTTRTGTIGTVTNSSGSDHGGPGKCGKCGSMLTCPNCK